jgi:hypothetical protein|tara:strand:+ start:517 stop:768 length:252 start_codon:yes stop_codon:yes gene_type:complete
MGWYNVRIGLSQSSTFEDMIEADSCEEAEKIASDSVWDDVYTSEIRAHLTIDDEDYDALEWCVECNNEIDCCECEEDEDESNN